MAVCGVESLLPCLACLVLGLMYEANCLSIQNLLIPDGICRVVSSGAGKWLGFSPTAKVRVDPGQGQVRPGAQNPPSTAQVDESAVERITAMGFQRDEAVQALRATGNDLDAALSRLL